MNKKILGLFFLSSFVFSQSLNDLRNISNQDLDAIKSVLQSSTDAIIEGSIDSVESNLAAPISITSTQISIDTDDYFGYNYFKKDVSFFDNIPTPADYRLGPGDEITISLWGEINSRENLTINKDGMIYYPNIGFINLSNLTINSAELLLIEELSRIYSTLKDKENSTKLMLELGKLKSINIYFSGHVENPGINLVHPFSDIFTAIIQAWGVNSQGSLREVQLIRNEKIITKVDFYSFFMNGKNTYSNIKLIDGDVIHIPSVRNRVSITGEINRPSTYELLEGESISDLITYSSGFTSDASSTLILNQIIPVNERISDDNARTSISINFKNKEPITLNNGDTVEVPPISEVDSDVIVFGRVKSPGSYPGVNTTLKNVLDIAGGFDDPVFRQTINEDEILILRQDKNQFFSKEISISYKNADQFILKQNDKIFVYEDINYRNSFIYRVEGEVFKPGTYPINTSNITVRQAIALAGGLTELSSEKNITVTQDFTSLDEDGNSFTTSETINNVTLDFQIGINSVIRALPIENVVRVEGNVYNPGLITYKKGLRYTRYLELAGGIKPNSLNKKIYIKRANGNEKVNGYFLSRLNGVYPGDTIFVPINPEPQDFNITTFVADLSITLANLAAIFLIIDNNSN